jgi:bisphosphoglycerate-independent phosphoglycerate mutase (AlkP superfamily)
MTLLICNYANGDMVGHTGDFNAAVKAVEALDVCLGRLYHAVKATGGEMLLPPTTATSNKCVITKQVKRTPRILAN